MNNIIEIIQYAMGHLPLHDYLMVHYHTTLEAYYDYPWSLPLAAIMLVQLIILLQMTPTRK